MAHLSRTESERGPGTRILPNPPGDSHRHLKFENHCLRLGDRQPEEKDSNTQIEKKLQYFLV